MSHSRVVTTTQAPAAIGPYSQALVTAQMVFTSGQLGLDPVTGNLVAADLATEARQALHNLAAVLAAAGTSLDQVVKTTVYLVDMQDFAAVNAVYAEFFRPPFPARVCVAVAALPKGGRVEIDALATLP